MSNVQFTTGLFQEYRVKVGFHLGRLSIDLKKDAVVEFEGTTLKMDGVVHSYPELRSAIRAEWLALAESNVGEYIAKSANVKVRSAKAGGPPASTVVQRDETHVGSATRKPAVTTTDGVRMETKKFNATLVRDTEGDGRSVGSAIRSKVATGGPQPASSEGELVGRVKSSVKTSFTLDGSTTMNALDDGTVIGSENIRGTKVAAQGAKPSVRAMANAVEPQEAQVVGGLRSPAKRKATVEDSNAAAREINKIENSRSVLAPKNRVGVSAVAGDTVEEILPALEPSGQAALIAEQKRRERMAAVSKSEGKKVAPPVVVETAPVADPPPAKANKPSKPVKTVKVAKDPAPKSVEDFVMNGDDLEIAPGLRWNKKLHWKLRVKNALLHKDNPEALQAILAYEVPSVAKLITDALGA